MSRPNFVVKDENGQEHWVSRSVVVVPVVIKVLAGAIYTLVEKRGPAVSHTGELCVPCGYLDWDESLEEACAREVHEETGLNLEPYGFRFVGVSGDPRESRQNVSMRFCTIAPSQAEIDLRNLETKDEVDDAFWKEIGYFDYKGNLVLDSKSIAKGDERWAFNHNNLIVEVLREFYKGIYNVILR